MAATQDSSPDRLAIIRRLYFYLIAAVSLMVGLSALSGLLAALLDVWLRPGGMLVVNSTGFIRDAIARQGGLLLVSTPIFLIHWRYIRRLARQTEEARAGLRKLTLYVILGLSLAAGAESLHRLIAGVVALIAGTPLQESTLWPVDWLLLPLLILLYLALVRYFLGQLAGDGDLGAEWGWAGTVRRLFQTIVGLVGLSLLLTGASGLLALFLRLGLERLAEPGLSIGQDLWRTGVSERTAGMLVGALLWRLNWRGWEGLLQGAHGEGRTALRRLYLYAATVISAALALVAGASLLREGLLFLLDVNQVASLPELSGSLGMLPLGAAAWWWHWRAVQQEAARFGDTPESITVRRLYIYLVAATGLVLLWLGLVETIRALLDWLVIRDVTASLGFRAEQLATGLSLLAVGAPVWALHWRAGQAAAGQEGDPGRNERASAPRRGYLYGVALVGALLILFELAQLLYRLLLWLLGSPEVAGLETETVDALVRSGVAAVFWIVHVLTIRTDARLTEEAGPAPEETVQAQRAALEARIQRLEQELAAARAELARLRDDQRE